MALKMLARSYAAMTAAVYPAMVQDSCPNISLTEMGRTRPRALK